MSDQETVQAAIDAGVPIPPRDRPYVLTDVIVLRSGQTLRGQ